MTDRARLLKKKMAARIWAKKKIGPENIHEKKYLGFKFGPKGTKSGPRLGLLSFSQVWFVSFV